ncbi:GFA family protein [bacterium]|nr:GFA family protein [bacterium]
MNNIARCSCGDLTLTYEGEITTSSICHCYSCQKRTGSIFGAQVRLKKSQVTTSGQQTTYLRVAESGTKISFFFCPKCAATIYWEIEGLEDSFIVAVGCFADSKFPAPTFSVFGARKHCWFELPNSVLDSMD